MKRTPSMRMRGTPHLLDPGLFALCRSANHSRNFPPSYVVFELRDLDIERIELLLNLLQLRRFLLLVTLRGRGPLALLPGLWLLGNPRLVQCTLELFEL